MLHGAVTASTGTPEPEGSAPYRYLLRSAIISQFSLTTTAKDANQTLSNSKISVFSAPWLFPTATDVLNPIGASSAVMGLLSIH